MALSQSELTDLRSRITQGGRLSLEEALDLRKRGSLVDLGQLAGARRKTLHGNRVSYVVNLHLNQSNLCVNHCRFCAFRRQEGQEGAYELSPEEVWQRAETLAPQGVREFHLVSALSPNFRLPYHQRVLRGLGERFPEAHLKAFTAVEIAHLAQIEDLSIEAVLGRLVEAGLGSLTGGGAETLSRRVRDEVCPEKLDGEGYLDVHRRAHRLGLSSTATLLFGHVETPRERLEHLCRLRELQDETGGFTAFVPLVFHPANTDLRDLSRASARLTLEMTAMSRILLDNFPHIKAYWISLGPKLAQTALAWGADDLDGTVADERIHHSAGAASPVAMSVQDLRRLATEAGFEPFERDALYNNMEEANPLNLPADKTPNSLGEKTSEILGESLKRGRMNAAEARELLKSGDLLELARAADAMRWRLHPDPIVTYNVDRNINTTNRCESMCAFCAFACEVDDARGWTLDREGIAKKIDELCEVSARLNPSCNGGKSTLSGPPSPPLPPQILMQGGLSPELDLAWYEDLFRWMRERWPSLHIHALSPPEIKHLSGLAGLDWRQTILRLKQAGLDSIPGGGAEILSERPRKALSPGKCTAQEWIDIMRTAHQEGLRTSATMVIGLGETLDERVEHLQRVRDLQDETQGFTAFIPWTLQRKDHDEDPENDFKMPRPQLGSWDYLRTLAVARLFLDNVENLQASWVTQGRDIAQIALLFGANDLGSTMLEENVVAAAGTRFRMSPEDLESLVTDLGLCLKRRDFQYRI